MRRAARSTSLGRIIAVRMGELLGQPVIVENMTGAGGIIGVNRVIAAKPDGYTFLLGTVGTHAYNQTIYKKRRYDAINDFTPVDAVFRAADGARRAQGPSRQHRSRSSSRS